MPRKGPWQMDERGGRRVTSRDYVLVLTARAHAAHAALARSRRGAPADPLAEAKDVLAGAGPLKAT